MTCLSGLDSEWVEPTDLSILTLRQAAGSAGLGQHSHHPGFCDNFCFSSCQPVPCQLNAKNSLEQSLHGRTTEVFADFKRQFSFSDDAHNKI